MEQHQRTHPASRLKDKFFGATVHLLSAFVAYEGETRKWMGLDEPLHKPPAYEFTWAMNGWWIHVPWCDLGFEMHDFGGPSYEAMGEGGHDYVDKIIGRALVPIFMPRADSRFPHVLVYPLQEVCEFFKLKEPYFGESTNYMIALATLWGVRRLVFHGFQYDPGYLKGGERASTEFWCGIAHSHGVVLDVLPGQNLLWPDPWEDFYEDRIYGYKRTDPDR